MLNQSMYSAVAISRSLMPCQGPRLRTSSALNTELKASAIALSLLSPFDPTEATMPFSEAFGVADRDVLDASVGMMNQPGKVPAGSGSGPD